MPIPVVLSDALGIDPNTDSNHSSTLFCVGVPRGVGTVPGVGVASGFGSGVVPKVQTTEVWVETMVGEAVGIKVAVGVSVGRAGG